MGVKSIEEVLREEVEQIHGETLETPALKQGAQEERRNFNADERMLADPDSDALKRRDEFYLALNKLNRAALCCSGGGIRSATFCLGVIQALAAYDVGAPPSPPPSPAKPADHGGADQHTEEAPHGGAPHDHANSKAAAAPASPKHAKTEPTEGANPALGRFHYLSTVSGGGYIGSWLSSWRTRADFPTVIKDLTRRPHGPDVEPPEISWLRAYSNYLTPQLGITSADSWAAVAIFVRNLVLNWLIIIPIVCLVLLALKEIATGGVLVTHWGGSWVLLVLALGIVLLICAQAFTTRHRPSRRGAGGKVEEQSFLWWDLPWAVLSAVAVTIFFASQYFAWRLDADCSGAFKALTWDGLSPQLTLPLVVAAAGFVVYGLGWSWGYFLGSRSGSPLSSKQKGGDFLCWAASGLAYGAIVGLGAYLFTLLAPYSGDNCSPSKQNLHLLLPTILGVPWVLTAQMVAEIVFVGLTCYEDSSD